MLCMNAPARKVWIGTSGYIYKHWLNGVFYPPRLPVADSFAYYARQFPTVEINVTFYRLAKEAEVERWHDDAPPGFRFVVKGSRFITHMLKLKEPQKALKNFFRPISRLKRKLHAVLWQFPRGWNLNAARLDEFLALYNDLTHAPAVLEFRNPTWFNAEVTGILKRRKAIYCRADLPEFYEELTLPDFGPIVYMRRHGAPLRTNGTGNYTNEWLARDAEQIAHWVDEGRSVYVYFNNDIGGHAPRNATTLARMVAKEQLVAR